MSFFTLEIWALAMDVIDSHELATGRREEAIGYAAFTFMRKIGQAIAAIAPALLGLVGYVASKGYGGQSEETVEGIYLLATVVPLIMFALMLVLMLLYPLGKKKDAEMREKLAALRAAREGASGNVGEGIASEDAAEETSEETAPVCGEEICSAQPEEGGDEAMGSGAPADEEKEAAE